MTSLTIATAGLGLLDDALRAQGVTTLPVDWRPPAGGDAADVALLTRAYADDEINEGNREAVRRLQSARPYLVGAGSAGDLIPGLEGRMILHAGPAVEWDRMCGPQRRVAAAAAVMEGWVADPQAGAAMLERGDIALAPAHSLGAAGAMCGIISPSMAVWAVRDEESGIEAWSPFCDGPGESFWLGVDSPAAIARQRLMADRVAPGIDRALALRGPIDVFALLAQAVAMGDDCHMRHQAATMLLIRELLPAMSERALDAIPPLAAVTSENGHFALTLTIASCRAALQGIVGVPRSSLIAFISRNGTDAAVMLAGLPGVWFTAPAAMVGDALYRPGFSQADAGLDIGDSALVECAGLGGAASAASPSVAAFLGGTLSDAVARTRLMGGISVATSERFRIPFLDGEGCPLGIDARLCLDTGDTPLINTGILHRTEGGQIGAGVAKTPLAPIRDALRALVPEPAVRTTE